MREVRWELFMFSPQFGPAFFSNGIYFAVRFFFIVIKGSNKCNARLFADGMSTKSGDHNHTYAIYLPSATNGSYVVILLLELLSG